MYGSRTKTPKKKTKGGKIGLIPKKRKRTPKPKKRPTRKSPSSGGMSGYTYDRRGKLKKKGGVKK